MGKTGGGPGTNQYKVRGQAKVASDKKRSKEAYGHPADQVVQRGDCAWLRGTFDDVWCLKHRQLAPEARQLMGLPLCATKLGPRLQRQLANSLPASALGSWVGQIPDADARHRLIARMPKGELRWVVQDEDRLVREAAVKRAPEGKLPWTVTDEDRLVRPAAAKRTSEGKLQWTVTDEDRLVRPAAAKRAPKDRGKDVR